MSDAEPRRDRAAKARQALRTRYDTHGASERQKEALAKGRATRAANLARKKALAAGGDIPAALTDGADQTTGPVDRFVVAPYPTRPTKKPANDRSSQEAPTDLHESVTPGGPPTDQSGPGPAERVADAAVPAVPGVVIDDDANDPVPAPVQQPTPQTTSGGLGDFALRCLGLRGTE